MDDAEIIATLLFVGGNIWIAYSMFKLSSFIGKMHKVEQARGRVSNQRGIISESLSNIREYCDDVDRDYKKIYGGM